MDGTVVALNDEVLQEPGLVNHDPYGAGWLYQITVTDLPDLLTAEVYQAMIGRA